jgi:hypothetical protein
MRRSPILVVIAGMVSTAYGAVLLFLAIKGIVHGIGWLGGCITLGGGILLAIWLRSAWHVDEAARNEQEASAKRENHET